MSECLRMTQKADKNRCRREMGKILRISARWDRVYSTEPEPSFSWEQAQFLHKDQKSVDYTDSNASKDLH